MNPYLSYIYRPPRTTAQSLFRWGLFSTGFLIFLPTVVFFLIIAFTPVATGAEEDAMESRAFFSWVILTAGLLLTSLSLYVSSLIAYLRNRHRQASQ